LYKALWQMIYFDPALLSGEDLVDTPEEEM
jgi:hypothetical protein